MAMTTSRQANTVTPPDGAWTEHVSGGVTLLSISSTKHKERPLRTENPRIPVGIPIPIGDDDVKRFSNEDEGGDRDRE
ncbi:hypothetical protein Tco_0747595 [Tanacetum coccineum]|uniref:Uncharacterized protein n=1 Tax=Tanacetum coccineum TaxID=301880 RepID=A0ABQ4YT76_9ASTR